MQLRASEAQSYSAGIDHTKMQPVTTTERLSFASDRRSVLAVVAIEDACWQ